MIDVASWFYEKVCDTFLECLIRGVQKSKKPIDDQSARVSGRCQEEKRKHTHGKALRGHFG
jgi:hypothetical protein